MQITKTAEPLNLVSALLLLPMVAACGSRAKSTAVAPVPIQLSANRASPAASIREKQNDSNLALGTDPMTQGWLERHYVIQSLIAPYGLRRLLDLLDEDHMEVGAGFTRADPSKEQQHPMLTWRLSLAETSASRTEALGPIESRLRGMGFASVENKADNKADNKGEARATYRRMVRQHGDEVRLSFRTFTNSNHEPRGSLSLAWYFALEHLGSEVTIGQVLKEAPHLRDPGVDQELYRFLEPLVVRDVYDSVRRTQAPIDWRFQKFWVSPPDGLEALLGRVNTVLTSRGFYVASNAAEIAMGRGGDWSESELYYPRHPERGLSLVMVAQSEGALMLALRIYPVSDSAQAR
jgi:hypothetical protein